MVLVGRFGVRGTALAAGALNLAAAAIAGVLSLLSGGSPSRGTGARRDPPHVRRPGPPMRPVPALRGPGTSKRLVAAFWAGFSLLPLEGAWFRVLLLFVSGHSKPLPVSVGVAL